MMLSKTHEPTENLTRLSALLAPAQRTLWVGAASFEERSLATLRALSLNGMRISRGLALDYTSVVVPAERGRRQREHNKAEMHSLASTIFVDGFAIHSADAHAFRSLSSLMNAEYQTSAPDLVVFDITCMTKVHVLALAALLVSAPQSMQWCAAYTVPENFGDLESMDRRIGWRDIVIVPLADSSSIYNETYSRGIILLGHENDRLVVALSEVQPSGGTVVVPLGIERPDLGYVARKNNSSVIRHLTRMVASEWTTCAVVTTDIDALERIVVEEAARAQDRKAPIILFPFGPKLMVFAAGITLLAHNADAAWFVCPVPSAYDADYSEGIDRTCWFLPR